jgi:hypothetical protein
MSFDSEVYFFSILIFLSIINYSFCQSNFKNVFFLELGGSGALYSINYERQFSHGLVGRFGFAYLPQQIIALPLTFGKVFGKTNHHFEINGGVTVANFPQTYSSNIVIRQTNVLGTGFFGYRYQKPDKRFFYRAGLTFFWRFIYQEDTRDEPPHKFLPWAAISVGYRF